MALYLSNFFCKSRTFTLFSWWYNLWCYCCYNYCFPREKYGENNYNVDCEWWLGIRMIHLRKRKVSTISSKPCYKLPLKTYNQPLSLLIHYSDVLLHYEHVLYDLSPPCILFHQPFKPQLRPTPTIPTIYYLPQPSSHKQIWYMVLTLLHLIHHLSWHPPLLQQTFVPHLWKLLHI